MTMAAHVTPGSHAPCGPERHTHPVPPTGGRCAFWSPGRPGDICGRPPVAVYVNPRAAVLRTYRCRLHDRDVNRAEAERQGYTRQAVGDA
jgi:hypothetical protein